MVLALVRAAKVSELVANILRILQADPRNYRNFGVFWWPVKALMREYYSADDLYLLGSYVDPGVAAMVPSGSIEQTLGRALAEYAYNARYNSRRSQVANEEGEMVTIFDEDAGL